MNEHRKQILAYLMKERAKASATAMALLPTAARSPILRRMASNAQNIARQLHMEIEALQCRP